MRHVADGGQQCGVDHRGAHAEQHGGADPGQEPAEQRDRGQGPTLHEHDRCGARSAREVSTTRRTARWRACCLSAPRQAVTIGCGSPGLDYDHRIPIERSRQLASSSGVRRSTRIWRTACPSWAPSATPTDARNFQQLGRAAFDRSGDGHGRLAFGVPSAGARWHERRKTSRPATTAAGRGRRFSCDLAYWMLSVVPSF